jgi:hypothetical protein
MLFFFNHEILNHVEDHVFNLISVFFLTAMKCYYSHDPLCICPFAINVSSSVLHPLSPVLLPQDCHNQTQTMLGILKSKACLPLH